jgi:dihydrofolate reductase
MADLVLAMFVSLDGCFEGPGGMAPPPWSDEVAEAWAGENLAAAAHLLYGRVNFAFNRDFWTSPAAADAPQTAMMNRLPKTLVSSTLSGDPGWNGTIVRGPDLAGRIAELKRDLSGDIYSFGGAVLAQSLLAADLVDVVRLMVTPQFLGGTRRLFSPDQSPTPLTLVSARTLDVGSVILTYRRNQ